jgi:hypothetical protein
MHDNWQLTGLRASSPSSSLFQGALQELSICLCRYNAVLERGVAGFFVKVSGIAIKQGLTRPSADVSGMHKSAWAFGAAWLDSWLWLS